MSGYFVDDSFVTVNGSVLGNNSRVPIDTKLAAGAAPQSGGIVPGTLAAPAAQIGLTALAGGGQTGATITGYGVNTVTTVATAADSVALPPAAPGLTVFVKNTTATSMTVYGSGIDTIDGIATATGVAQAAGKGKLYYGTSSTIGATGGTWVSLLGA